MIPKMSKREKDKTGIEETKERPDLEMKETSHPYSKKTVEILVRWLGNNRRNPYPKYLQRIELCK